MNIATANKPVDVDVRRNWQLKDGSPDARMTTSFRIASAWTGVSSVLVGVINLLRDIPVFHLQ